MEKNKYFSGASRYFILEGKARFMLEHFGSEDELAKERIEFKENLISDLVVRLVDADLKINMILTAKEKYEEEKRKDLSAEVALECSLLDDALQTSLLEVAEILSEFLARLRTTISARCHLFRKCKKILSIADEVIQEKYSQSRFFLFPEFDDAKNNGKVKESYFHDIADRLEVIGNPILKFRDKVLAHKYDKDRFITRLSLKQYSEIRDAFRNTLDSVAIVGTLSSNDWSMTRSHTEIIRTDQWLKKGLIAAATPLRMPSLEASRKSFKTVQSPVKPLDIKR